MLYFSVLGSNFEKLLSYLKPMPSNFLSAKFDEKEKNLKVGIKNAWFAYFGAVIWEYYCHIWNQSPGICLIANFVQK